MHKENCERCCRPTNGKTIMSMFNQQVICLPCKDSEKLHKDYNKASESEIAAYKSGDRNFAGIGLPQELLIEAAFHEASTKHHSTLINLGNG